MIDDDLNRSRESLAACDELLNHCLAELELLSESLSDLRRRQKAEFGDYLIRTTLAHSIKHINYDPGDQKSPEERHEC